MRRTTPWRRPPTGKWIPRSPSVASSSHRARTTTSPPNWSGRRGGPGHAAAPGCRRVSPRRVRGAQVAEPSAPGSRPPRPSAVWGLRAMRSMMLATTDLDHLRRSRAGACRPAARPDRFGPTPKRRGPVPASCEPHRPSSHSTSGCAATPTSTRSSDRARRPLGLPLRFAGDRACRSCRAAGPAAATAWSTMLDHRPSVSSKDSPAGAPLLKRALQAYRTDHAADAQELRSTWRTCCAPPSTCGTTTAWDEQSARNLDLAHRSGALTALPLALRHGSACCLGRRLRRRGLGRRRWRTARTSTTSCAPDLRIFLATSHSREETSRRRRPPDESTVGEGQSLRRSWARALLYDGLGRPRDALASTEIFDADPLRAQGSRCGPWSNWSRRRRLPVSKAWPRSSS